MTIEKKIIINNNEYLLGVQLYYDKKKICKKFKSSNYFDFGDFSYLIENIEKNYIKYTYDNEIEIMNDIIYIFDNIPFISYIKEVNKNSCILINSDEIKEYILNNNIKLNNYYLNSVTPLFFK